MQLQVAAEIHRTTAYKAAETTALFCTAGGDRSGRWLVMVLPQMRGEQVSVVTLKRALGAHVLEIRHIQVIRLQFHFDLQNWREFITADASRKSLGAMFLERYIILNM